MNLDPHDPDTAYPALAEASAHETPARSFCARCGDEEVFTAGESCPACVAATAHPCLTCDTGRVAEPGDICEPCAAMVPCAYCHGTGHQTETVGDCTSSDGTRDIEAACHLCPAGDQWAHEVESDRW